MDAINVLKHDHRTVRGLFRKFAQSGKRATMAKRRISDQVFNELEIHTAVEGEIFYPAVRDAGNGKGYELVREAFAEHDAVTNLINDLKGLSHNDDEYDAKFTVLEENVKHHIEEEERHLFPYAERTLDETRLKDLGRQMADRKHALTAPSLLGESIRRAKAFVREAVAAVSGAGHEPNHPRQTRSHKRLKPTTPRTDGQQRKGEHAARGKAVAARKPAHAARAT